MRRPILTLVAAIVGLGVAGCGSGAPTADTTSTGGPSTATSATLSGDLTVLAAASLTEAFITLGEQFEAAHPKVDIRFSFAASTALAAQIIDGAPADVFASAGATPMDDVMAAGAAAEPVVFATNVMEIAVPPTNPGDVMSLDDLADEAVTTALCQPQVPCG